MMRENEPGGAFPNTQVSAIAAARDGSGNDRARALDAIVAAYWKPAYKYVRLRWRSGPEDAEDLVQGFFARALEKSFFQRYEPGRARFRTYLRVCLDGHVANERKAEGRLKRGGGVDLLPLDFATAEGEVRRHDAPVDDDPDATFEREWARGLFERAIESLRADCAADGHEARFRAFERYDLAGDDADRPSYAALAAELSLPVTTITNHLAWARREFRRRVLADLRSLCGDDAEFRAEAKRLLNVEAP
jgi:RNA polymerase sigma factor (sigma-70 family)